MGADVKRGVSLLLIVGLGLVWLPTVFAVPVIEQQRVWLAATRQRDHSAAMDKVVTRFGCALVNTQRNLVAIHACAQDGHDNCNQYKSNHPLHLDSYIY